MALNLDAVTLKAAPRDAVRSGQFNKVPVLQGSNRFEGRRFTPPSMTPDDYRKVVGAAHGSGADAVLAEYPLTQHPSPAEAYGSLIGDSMFSCDSRSIIRELAGSGATVYAYEFRDPDPPMFGGARIGPVHFAEVLYVFQDSISVLDESALTPTQLQLSNQMLSYWTNFARAGDPNASGLPKWNTYSSSADRFFALTSEPGPAEVTDFAALHYCAFWATQGI